MADKEDLRIARTGGRRLPQRVVPSFSSLMDDFFDDFFNTEPFLSTRERVLSPRVDIIDKPNEFLVKAEIPGVDKKDLDIEIGDDYITLRGEKKETEEHKEEDYYYKESFHGKFLREIALPEKVKSDAAKATYENGILKISIPKAEESKAKKIEVA